MRTSHFAVSLATATLALAFLALLAPGSALGQTAGPEKIVDDAIIVFLKAIDGQKPELAKLVQIGALMKRIALLDRENLAAKTLKELQAAIDKIVNDSTTAKPSAEALKLELVKIEALAAAAKSDKQKFGDIGDQITLLDKAKLAVNPQAPAPEDEKLRTHAGNLGKLLDGLALADFENAPVYLEQRIEGLTNLLTDHNSIAGRERLLAIQNAATMESATLPGKLMDFHKALITALGKKPYVHIVRAWAGDLSSDWNERYMCNATRVLQKKCITQQASVGGKCTPYQSEAKDDPTEAVNVTKLCGYDPYPAKYDLNWGLAVQYACLPDSELVKISLDRHPDIHPLTGEPFGKQNTRQVTLRRTDTEIFCAYPDSDSGIYSEIR